MMLSGSSNLLGGVGSESESESLASLVDPLFAGCLRLPSKPLALTGARQMPVAQKTTPSRCGRVCPLRPSRASTIFKLFNHCAAYHVGLADFHG